MAVEFPDSPLGEQGRWFVRHMETLGRDLTEAEVLEHLHFPPPWKPVDSIERFASSDPRPFTVSRVRTPAQNEIAMTFDFGDDKPFTMALTLEPEPPYRIVRTWWSRAVADDVVFRAATAADATALNDLEVRAPMTIGAATKVVYDRGQDFLAFARLMEENVCFVAERDGELLGIACGAAHPVRIGGKDYRVMLLHHLRVPVEHRKGGVFSNLNGYVFGAYEGRTDGAYGYTALDNAEAMRIGGPGTWSVTVYRAVIDCRQAGGEPLGRTATKDDAPHIVELINGCHEREEVFRPYTVESLTERLERAPEVYTWNDILVGDSAVLGVWPANVRVSTDDEGHHSEETRAVVLDHGFVGHDGAAEFKRLLQARCGSLASAGHTELTFLTSDPSPTYGVVASLAKRMDPFAFRMAVPEPPGTSERGVYVDAIYF